MSDCTCSASADKCSACHTVGAHEPGCVGAPGDRENLKRAVQTLHGAAVYRTQTAYDVAESYALLMAFFESRPYLCEKCRYTFDNALGASA